MRERGCLAGVARGGGSGSRREGRGSEPAVMPTPGSGGKKARGCPEQRAGGGGRGATRTEHATVGIVRQRG